MCIVYVYGRLLAVVARTGEAHGVAHWASERGARQSGVGVAAAGRCVAWVVAALALRGEQLAGDERPGRGAEAVGGAGGAAELVVDEIGAARCDETAALSKAVCMSLYGMLYYYTHTWEVHVH